MSGIAIVLENADFSQKNIGKVNFITDVPVTGISITGEPSAGDPEVTLGISYTPIGTSQRGVDWSVVSGAATINQSGVLVPDEFVDTDVVVSAVSKFNPSIYATKEVAFAYENLTPSWTSGFYSKNGDFSTSGEGRYYTIEGGLPLSSDYYMSCENGFLLRIVSYRGVPSTSTFISRSDNFSSGRATEIAPSNATYICINVCHDDVTGPTVGTIMTPEEVARLNEIVTITPLNK